MKVRLTEYRGVAIVFSILAIAALAIWSLVPGYVVGWDLQVYRAAIISLRAGHDPYLDGMAVQRIFHAELVHAPDAPTPFTYVYSPITLPLIRLVALTPLALSGTMYWVLYCLAAVATLWVGMRFVEKREMPVFALLVPAAIFFPGLLQNDVFFSGNVACILYALVLLGAVAGWRRGQWVWFYAAVLVASCFKAPLLSLLAIPVFSARRQWWPAILTGALGLGLFAVQPLIWPSLFRHYLEAVELQFSFNHDFSSSPAGLVADALYDVIPYQITSAGFYLFYGAGVFAILLSLSKRYFAGEFSLQRWAPVVLTGTLLLNPRIMEYDVAPITLVMALLLWRFLGRGNSLAWTAGLGAVLFAAMNAAAACTPPGSGVHLWWRPTEALVLSGVFGMGAWDLFTHRHGSEGLQPAAEDALLVGEA